MLRVLATLAIAYPLSASAADCPAPVDAATLQATLDAAEAAYGRVDVDAFTGSMTKARAQMPCVEEAITPALAAKLHRLEGLAAFADSARERATQAFAAARSLEPDYTFPTTVVQPGNPLLDQYKALDPVCEEEKIPPAKDGKLRVDGQSQRLRPLEFPVLVQVIDPEGEGAVTAYLWPGDALPYQPGTVRTPTQTALLAGGVGVAVAGLATFIAGAGTQAREGDNLDAIARKSTTNDTLMGIGAGVGVLGATGVVLSFALPSKNQDL